MVHFQAMELVILKRIRLDRVKVGDELAGTIKVSSPTPGVLYRLKLKEGTELTEEKIDRLERLGITKVPIKDPATDDLDDYVHDESVERAKNEVRNAFDHLTDNIEDDKIGGEDIKRLRSAVSSLIDALKNSKIMAAFTTLKTHDNYTAEHSLDVSKISLQLALEYEREMMNRLKEESGASSNYINRYMLEDLALGAMLHDLGKKKIPKEILTKNDKLNDDEWEAMTEHPKDGYRELKKVDFSIRAPVKTPALQHHEKYDGTGYPRGLEGDEIHLFGRISACADVYSALTSNRPYRDAQTPAKALSIMKSMQEEGPHFAPDIYEKFLTLVYPYPVGDEVMLSDGRSGVVCHVDQDNPRQPVVRITHDGDTRLDDPEELQIPNRPGDLQIEEPSSEVGGLIRA
jgi:HD-GYP domain-containing protein (c-di-GMP phosphodiesterase class II)